MEDGSCAQHNVHARMDLAEELPKIPAVLNRAHHATSRDEESQLLRYIYSCFFLFYMKRSARSVKKKKKKETIVNIFIYLDV